MVALDPDTGKLKWHFQFTPNDPYDYDSVQVPVLADIEWQGRQVKAMLWANRNGYFYVLDAKSGQFLSAGSIAPQNWTTGIDPRTGKATVNPAARYEQTGKLFLGRPGGGGAHGWFSMSFSPKTGLVYVPANFDFYPYLADRHWNETAMGYQTGADFAVLDIDRKSTR